MSSSQSHLRAFRRERGWTQQDVADRLQQLAEARWHSSAGVSADMVSKWERGTKRPSRFYRELLCLLFGSTAARLGLIDSPAAEDTLGARPGAGGADDVDVAGALTGSMSVLELLGPAGTALQPAMFDVWKGELMRRRSVLRIMSLAPAALTTDLGRRMPANGRALVDTPTLTTLADQYQRLYHSAVPSHLMTAILAHLATVENSLRGARQQADRQAFLRNQSQVSLLAGRMAFFDLHDSVGARGYYSLALESAREGQDPLLVAAVLGHMSFVAASDRRFAAGVGYVESARKPLRGTDQPLMMSWLAAVESEIRADAGDERGSFAAVDTAASSVDEQGAITPVWFDFYDPTRLDGFEGYARLQFGAIDRATEALESAAISLPQSAIKQRAVALTDLASVQLHAHDVPQACSTAGDAAELLAQASYATGSERLHEFRDRLDDVGSHPAVKELDERLALI